MRAAFARLPANVQAVGLLLAVTAVAALFVSVMTSSAQHTAAPPTPITRIGPPTATPIPATLPGPLDGLPTSRGNALRRPIAVMVDNFVPDALPQPGLLQASLVFETVVEGGLTRLMPVYLEQGATAIGPIRSARPYFVAWAAGYKALFVHDGGSPAAQRLLFSTPQLANVEASTPLPGFQRLPSQAAPHNLYASTAAVRATSRKNHWNKRVVYPWIPHKKPANAGLRGSATTINVDFSTPDTASPSAYAVSWSYDAQRNVYLRSMGGNPVDDRDTGNQIVASNVVVLFTQISKIPHDKLGRVNVAAVGTGEAAFFLDGRSIPGRWEKKSVLAPLRLLDTHGHQIALNPGTTWIEVVPPGGVQTSGLP